MDYINHREMMTIDGNSTYFGVGLDVLMENAGKAVFNELKKIPDIKKKSIIIVSGQGNNGGDGFVVGRHLQHNSFDVKSYLVGERGDIKTETAMNAFDALKDAGVMIVEMSNAGGIDFGVDIILDGLLGTGLKGDPRKPFNAIIEKINASDTFKISIDVPSGLGSRVVVNSDLVIALHSAKTGLGGYKRVVRDIGIPKKAITHVGPGDLSVNLKRDSSSHKGNNGRLLVIGGSINYYGAPILSALGALGAGCDLTTLIVPEKNFDVTRCHNPDFIVSSYSGDFLNNLAVEAILYLSKSHVACVLGPGLGISDETREAVNSILTSINIPVVIDADALKLVDKNVLKDINAVLTPHVKEFAGLTRKNISTTLGEKKRVIGKWANEFSTTVLLKSPIDIIASSDGRIKLNETGNSGMTVGGTGDVLAGIVGSFIAQGMNPFAAACCSAFVNGVAGDFLYQFKGYGYTASDVAKEIPYTIKRTLELYG